MLCVGKKSPDINCDAVIDGVIKHFNLSTVQSKYKLLFFYPLDFTFVCPTELHALQDRLVDFAKRNVEVLAISVDSVYSHLAWLEVSRNKGGIAGVSYPLLGDITKNIAREYGVLHAELGVALRGVFLLDKDNVVQYAAVNNLALGRNIGELLRVVDALTHVQSVGEVCPANWEPQHKAMKPNTEGLKEYFAS
ncbi:peroxiredoxin [Candidatus Dependentiae bacterium]|nr:peroxiredoxin [Candidatus Dependentiae bacterium]